MKHDTQGITQQACVVILAAGKGTRMGRADLAKVCFEIDGVPAINRLIGTFRQVRFAKFLVVVGSMAGQVIETVGNAYPDVMFVAQIPQLGTGHAAKVAAEALQKIGHTGPVVVSLGDKFIEPVAVEMLVDGFIRQQADLALLTVPRTRSTELSSGRVLVDGQGQAVDIIERPDIARQAIADELRARLARGSRVTSRTLRAVAERHIDNPGKLAKAVPELLALCRKDGDIDRRKLESILAQPRYRLTIDGRLWTARQIEKACRQFNPSLYLFTADAFYQGVALIDNDNAQGEYYLTDVVRHLSGIEDDAGQRRFRVRTVPAETADVIQGFNSPEELLHIQDYVRRKKNKVGRPAGTARVKPRLRARQYASVREWLRRIEEGGPRLRRWLTSVYGAHEALHAEKCRQIARVLTCYGKRFGFDEKVVIVRAPGRINLMGRHVDHRGGFNNFLALDRETIAVAGLRDDDNVIAVNTEPKKFKPRRFSIDELIGRFAWSDWINFVNSQWVRNLLRSTTGDWSNYIKAAMLRLQHHYHDLRIRGLNMALTGNVPIAAGLSSSSTIVVATLQAAIALNNLELTARQFIDLCGEGEWFVGSRGGAGDHAAIYLGQRGKIAQVGYLPFRVERVIDAPRDYQVLIANSHIQAAKSQQAKDQFNARVACYELGLALLKQRCPQIRGVVEYVRDLSPERIGCTTSELYRLLLNVPEAMTRKEFQNTLAAEHRDLMERTFASHRDPGVYDVRGVLLFGAAECQRSRICMDDLAAGRIDRFGQLMRISHDGDRVARPGRDGTYVRTKSDCSDAYLQRLIADLGSEDPQRVLGAQLYMQPGGYGCSTPEIDRMVDIACRVPGVAGAQIAGAGLGGCIMILAKKEAIRAVRKALADQYYKPRGLPPAVLACTTVNGTGLCEF